MSSRLGVEQCYELQQMSDIESFVCGVDARVDNLLGIGELLGELALGRDVRQDTVAQLGEERRSEYVHPTRHMTFSKGGREIVTRARSSILAHRILGADVPSTASSFHPGNPASSA
jgi:hypothetical protein